eukprot:880372-Amphidinium_carterae.1
MVSPPFDKLHKHWFHHSFQSEAWQLHLPFQRFKPLQLFQQRKHKELERRHQRRSYRCDLLHCLLCKVNPPPPRWDQLQAEGE